MKYTERLRKMFKMEVKMGLSTKDPFAKYRKYTDKVELKSLTKQELDRLESKRFRATATGICYVLIKLLYRMIYSHRLCRTFVR